MTYTDSFRQRQAPYLLGLLFLNIPILIAVIAKGRWSSILRRINFGLSLATCAALMWTALDGPVFIAPVSDRAMKGAMILTVAVTVIAGGIHLFRGVKPAPTVEARAEG